MIVNYSVDGWEVITQRAHGVLAAQIAMHWKKEYQPARWTETVLAIAEHDDAEIELAGENLITNTGGPLNFIAKKFDLQHAKKLSMLSRSKSRYIALVTSMHLDFIYRQFEQNSNVAHVFLKEQRMLRQQWMKEIHITKKEITRIYALLQWCDALSLVLCQRQIPPEHRALEISKDETNTAYYLKEVEEGVLTVDPWPFQEKEILLNYESRTIAKIEFTSTNEFIEGFEKAKIKNIEWILRSP